MKVRVVSRTCGPGRSRRKSPKSRARDRVGTAWGSPIGMNSAQPIPAERIRRSWGMKEGEAKGPVGRKVGARGVGWKNGTREGGAEAWQLQGLAGPKKREA